MFQRDVVPSLSRFQASKKRNSTFLKTVRRNPVTMQHCIPEDTCHCWMSLEHPRRHTSLLDVTCTSQKTYSTFGCHLNIPEDICHCRMSHVHPRRHTSLLDVTCTSQKTYVTVGCHLHIPEDICHCCMSLERVTVITMQHGSSNLLTCSSDTILMWNAQH